MRRRRGSFFVAFVFWMAAVVIPAVLPSAADPSAFGIPLLSSGVALAAPKGQLRLYTSQPDADAQKTAAAFEALYPGVEVIIFRSGTEEVVSRFLLEAEAGAPQADVLLIADAPTFEILKSRGMLESYRSPHADDIDPAYYDPDFTYYGTKIMATVIAYNTLLARPLESWNDLKSLRPGQVAMPDPNYSGAAAYNLGVFTRTPGIGWEWYEALRQGRVLMTQGNGAVLRAVASGERPYGIIVEYLAIRAKQDGSPVDIVYPKEGVPVITEPVGIVKGTKNLEAAQAFVDFLLSREGQALAAEMGYMPLRHDVEPPAGFPPLSDIRALSVDTGVLVAERENDKERFNELFGEW